MRAGDVVYNEYHGIRRYGVVTETYIKQEQNCFVPWAYAKVEWFNDGAYDTCVETTDKLRNREGENKTIRLTEYRVDQLKQIDLEKEMSTLAAIKQFKENL